MTLVTPREDYETEVAHAFILPLEKDLEAGIQVLMDSSVVQRNHSEISRRDPGRNFVFTERWVSACFSIVIESRLTLPTPLQVPLFIRRCRFPCEAPGCSQI